MWTRRRRLGWLIVCSAMVLIPVLPASAQQQQTCFQSKFGAADEIGAANNLSPEKTLAATKLVTKGKAYRLGIETNKDTPAYPRGRSTSSWCSPARAAA